MADSHTVPGVLGFLMSVIDTKRKIAWAGELPPMRELDSNFKSLQLRDSIQSITGVMRQCGCFQVRLKIQRTRLWWKCTAPMYCLPQWRVWCMPSGLNTRTLSRMRHTGWSKLQSHGRYEGVQKRNWRMGNHWFGYWRRMHTLLISNRLRTSKLNSRLLWRDTLYRVRPERGGFIDGSWHVSHWYWETTRIGMTFYDNGTMNGHSILGWNLWFSDG